MGRREEYSEQILDFIQEGDVRNVTMEQIAEKLGVTKRTLYNYFEDKASMLRDVLDHHIQQNFDHVNTLINKSAANSVIVMASLIDFAVKNHKNQSPLFIRSIYEYYPEIFSHCDALSRRVANEFFVDNIEKGRSEGLYHTDFNPQTISRLVFNAMDSVRYEDVLNADIFIDFRDTFRDITICILRGIVTREGSEILEREIKKIYKI